MKDSALLVGNWESDVGYAWWLMESFWVSLNKHFEKDFNFILVYPKVTKIPEDINKQFKHIEERDFSNFKNLFEQLKFIYRNKIKWIYFTDKPSWHISYLLFRLAGVKVIIIHDHSPGMREKARGVKFFIKYFVNRLPGITADGVFSVTEYIYNRHIDTTVVPKENCYVVENGIKLEREITEVDIWSKFNIPENRKIMVAASRANRYKNIQFVINCMDVIVNHMGRKDIHFLFCGDGPDLSSLKELLREKKLDEFVSMPGKCSNILGIFSNCDLAIHPSYGEVGYSLSILECMYSHLPVFVPDNPSVCSATRHGVTGMIYKENDVNSAVNAILLLVDDDKKRKTIGDSANQIVIERYNLDNTHKSLVDATYKVLLRKGLF